MQLQTADCRLCLVYSNVLVISLRALCGTPPHRYGRKRTDLLLVQLQTHGILIDMVNLRDGDGHILLPPQMPLAQHQMGDTVVGRIDQKLVYSPNRTVGGMNARPAMHRYFVWGDILMDVSPFAQAAVAPC
jgi:hypothetical protein